VYAGGAVLHATNHNWSYVFIMAAIVNALGLIVWFVLFPGAKPLHSNNNTSATDTVLQARGRNRSDSAQSLSENDPLLFQ
jgi:hypothetical protein